MIRYKHKAKNIKLFRIEVRHHRGRRRYYGPGLKMSRWRIIHMYDRFGGYNKAPPKCLSILMR